LPSVTREGRSSITLGEEQIHSSEGIVSKFKERFAIYIFLLTLLGSCSAQSSTNEEPPHVRRKAKPVAAKPASPQLSESRKFVREVVAAAVAIPQPDPQDRLRVLNSAIGVTARSEPKLTAKFADEAVRIESSLIASGQTPAASVVATGYANCTSVARFVEHLYPTAVAAAEQSLIGAVGKCPKQTLELVRSQVDAGIQQGIFAPRLMMVLMNASGKGSTWSQSHFVSMFGSLPSPDAKSSHEEAPNFAAMFSSMAPEVDKDVAGQAGLKLLTWLGKFEGDERNLAVNITTSSLKKLFGEDGYEQLLQKDVMAAQVARTAGAPGHVAREQEESASPLEASHAAGGDQEEALKGLPPSLRARQAAADGFVVGKSDKKAAERYFDIAFSAANEAWAKRTAGQPDYGKRIASLIEEVSEAAAHIDPLDALTRAQGMQDSSARAIGMIAVARVVMTKDLREASQ
jgi:hypothetical protein